jgi:O-antigen/teichoic acid export membrane protein
MTSPGSSPPPGPPHPRTLARNTLLSGVGEGSNLLLFLLGFLVPRLLGPVPFGEYSTAMAFVGLFRILPDFGMSYASTLAISRDRSLAGRFVGGLLGFQALLSVLTLALCLGIGRAQYEGVTWLAVAILSIDLLLKSVKSTLRWLLKALEHFGTEAVSLLAERVALLGLGLAALLGGYGVLGFVVVFAGVRLVDTAALWAWIDRRVMHVVPHYDPALWWELLRKGLPIAYAGAMITLIFQVDAVLLEHMRGPGEAGLYNAPVLVLAGLTLIPRVLGYAFLPTMAALHPARPDAITGLYRRGSKYLMVVGFPIGAFGLLHSEPFMQMLFGADFRPSALASRLLLPAAVFMFLSNFGETTLACVSRWGSIVAISTASLLLNVGLNLMWIPADGYVGSARATLVTEAVYFALTALALRRFGYRLGWLRTTVRPVLATAVFAGVLWVGSGRLPLLASCLLATAAFAAATFALGVWDEKERGLLRDLLRGGRPDAGSLAT